MRCRRHDYRRQAVVSVAVRHGARTAWSGCTILSPTDIDACLMTAAPPSGNAPHHDLPDDSTTASPGDQPGNDVSTPGAGFTKPLRLTKARLSEFS